MSPRGDQTAYAVNWKNVLAADALVGAVPFVVGLVLALQGSVVWGGLSASAGALYVLLVARRALRWKRLRADADLF